VGYGVRYDSSYPFVIWSMEKRALLAFVISVVIITVWTYWFTPQPEVAPPSPEPAKTTEPEKKATATPQVVGEAVRLPDRDRLSVCRSPATVEAPADQALMIGLDRLFGEGKLIALKGQEPA